MSATAEPEVARWVGQPLKRREDPELLTGRGRFLGDVERPGMLHAAFARSPHAHARIAAIDTARALALPGVHAVLTGADLPADLPPQPITHDIPGARETPFYALSRDRVRYVGEPVAIVVADSRYLAEDGVDALEVTWETLPAVIGPEAALAPGAPLLWEELPDNVIGSGEAERGDVEAALAAAAVVVRDRFELPRLCGSPLEGRGVVAEWDADGEELCLWTSSQLSNQARDFLAEMLHVPTNAVRVRVPRVGGGFGVKFHFYPEEVAVPLAARAVGRPVRWLEDRREAFATTVHARGMVVEATMAASADGEITAMEVDIAGDLGAALHSESFGPLWMTATLSTGVYTVPNARVRYRGVATNATPVGAYRGWGAPEANLINERLLERTARELGLDPAEVRRRSLVPFEQQPYQRLTYGMPLHGAHFHDALERALELSGYAGWRERQAAARAEGRCIGIGMSVYAETSGMGASRSLNWAGLKDGTFDITRVVIDPGGKVTAYTGLCEMGQGLTNAIAQMCADRLGVDPGDVKVVTGDTQSCPYTGFGTAASRGASVASGSVAKACGQLRDKVETIAAHMLEATRDQLVLSGSRIWLRDEPERAVTTAQVAHAAYRWLLHLPDDMEPGLEAIGVFDPELMESPCGVNVAVVEVDPETGTVAFLDYVLVHDCGVVVNPLIVDGQITGAIAQGIGMALHEEARYDGDGRPLHRTFADYQLPTAAAMPRLRLGHSVTPSEIMPGGVKGVGEAGTIGTPASIVNAIEDALSPFGVRVGALPVTPARLLALLEETR